ncbi:MAG: PhoH family protein [Firmicutes bacterium]|nr:PhoH family protein [Bacillota bacterium]
MRTIDRTVSAERVEDLIAVFGSFDENIHRIEEAFGVTVVNRSTDLKVTGEEESVDKAVRTLEGLLSLSSKGEQIDEQRVRYLITLVSEGNDSQIQQMAKDVVCITAKGKPIKAKTVGQQNYMQAIAGNTVTIGVGPAGTGKTYLAVAAAVAAFRERTVNRIILTRPAVEAGERLGFLPGDLQNKVDPYLRPLYDALYDMLGAETFQKYQERGSIEVAPLAYMRGRTLDDSFIILDEAQNTTKEQMKMFLTRLGFGSKIVITGDVTQIDLPEDKVSGLKDAIRILEGVEDIAICRLTSADVVRHALVQRIINAYEKADKKSEMKKASRNTQGNRQRKNRHES